MPEMASRHCNSNFEDRPFGTVVCMATVLQMWRVPSLDNYACRQPLSASKDMCTWEYLVGWNWRLFGWCLCWRSGHLPAIEAEKLREIDSGFGRLDVSKFVEVGAVVFQLRVLSSGRCADQACEHVCMCCMHAADR
jgi:hypothetical protein